MNLDQKIEAVLFWKNEPMSRKKLADIFGVEISEINESVQKLKVNLGNRGIVLLEKEEEVTLGTAPELSSLLEKLQKEEFSKDLSKASLETLSIVLYKNGASRPLIDYIRGVNSSFILRALSVRGLVERTPDPEDSRRFVYKPTFDLLSYLGVRSVEELPDYETVIKSVDSAAQNLAEELKNETDS